MPHKIVVTLESLSRETGIPRQTLSRWKAGGLISPGLDGWDVASVKRAAARIRNSAPRKSEDDAEIQKWKRRRLRAIALKGETELKRTLGEYVKIESVREAYLALGGVIRSTFAPAAARWALAMDGMDAVARKAFLDGEIRRALERVDDATKSISIEVAELDAEDAAPDEEDADD